MPTKLSRHTPRRPRYGRRPFLEILEDRTLLTFPPFPSTLESPLPPEASQTGEFSPLVGDFNHDGKLDLVASNTAIDVLMGNGDGTFQKAVTYESPALNQLSGIVTGDLNHDGNSDLVACTTFGVYVLLGNPDGTFQAPVATGLGGAASMALADLTGNGNLDLVLGSSGTVTIAMGNGDGTFRSPTQIRIGNFNRTAIAVGDFTSNGKLDLLVAGDGDTLGHQLIFVGGNGDGTFQPPVTVATNHFIYSMAVGDLSGNGKLDIVTAEADYHQVQVWMGNGDGTFQAPVSYPAGNYPTGVTVADLTGNGKPDIIAADLLGSSVAVLRNNGDGTFAPMTVYNVSSEPTGVAVGDYTANGVPDIVSLGTNISLLPGNGDGTFQDSYETFEGSEGPPYRITSGDLTGSGLDSIVASVYRGDGVSVMVNNGHGGFDAPVFYSTGPQTQPQGVALADLSGNGILDLVVTDTYSNAISVFIGNGDGTFQAPVTYASAGTFPDNVAIGDVFGNGKLDVVVLDDSNDISVFPGNGDGTLGKPVAYKDGLNGSYPLPSGGIVLADLNGDGKLDVAVDGPEGAGVNMLLNNGDGTFGAPVNLVRGWDWGLAAGDLTGNGRIDLVATTTTNLEEAEVLLNNGDGTFSVHTYLTNYLPGVELGGVAIADFDGDGNPDLVLGSNSSQVEFMQGNGDGTFQTPVLIDSGASPRQLTLGNFDGGGLPEVALANSISTEVTVLESGGNSAAVRDKLTLSGPRVTLVGDSVTYTLTVTNPSGQVDTNYTGTVQFTSSDPAAALPPPHTFTASDQGVYTFTVTLNTAGNQTVTATDTGSNPAIPSTRPVTVGSGQFSPSFSLSAPTILAGTPSTTISGHLNANAGGANVPAGEGITVTLAGVTQTATLDAGDNFSATFATGALTAAGSPYAINFGYAGDADFAPATGQSTLTVNALTPGFSNLSSPTIVFGAASTTVSGHLGANAGGQNVPAGEGVSVTLGGVTQTATLDASDNFSATFATGSLAVAGSPYPIDFGYAGDANFLGATGHSTLTLGPASPSFSHLGPPAINVGAATTVVTGHLDANADGLNVPAGEGVSVTLNGVTVAAALNNNDDFSATFATGSLTVAGSPYTINFAYAGDADFNPATATSTLIVQNAPTAVFVPDAAVPFSQFNQPVVFDALVTSAAGTVNVGVVVFTVFDAGNHPIGSPATSATVLGGAANATFTVPAGTPVGFYTIKAQYSGGTGFQPGATTAQLAVDVVPAFAPINGNNSLSLPHDQFPATVAISASSALGGSLTYTATAAGDNPIFDLQQQYHFTGVGYLTAGATAYVLKSGRNNASASPATATGSYYLLKSDGGLYAYDGSGYYAHTFANSSPLANLGANAYADPTLLTSAQAPVDYAALHDLQQKYRFTGVGYMTAGATAYVLHSDVPGPGVLGYYLLRSDGALFAYDGSGSYAHSFAGAIPLATPGAGVYAAPDELLGAWAAPALYAQLQSLNRQYDLQELGGSFYSGTLGYQAQWLYSPIVNQFGQHWYTLTTDAGNTQALLRAWQGFGDSTSGAVVATLDPAVFGHPDWLTAAVAPPGPAVTVGIDAAGVLSIALPADYAGTFKVTVTASDGMLSSTQTALVTATDSAPTLTIRQGATTIQPGGTLTVARGSMPLTATVSTTGSPGSTVTATAAVSGYSLPFALQQRYQFRGLGYLTAGATAYVLQASSNNGFGNSYYLLKSDGGLYAYDGSGSFAHTFADSTNLLATLGTNFYADPALLTNAQPAVDYTSLYNLQQQYQFTGLGYITTDATAYVLHSNQPGPGVGGFYLLRSDGTLFPYDGSDSYAFSFIDSNPIASLGAALYADPAALLGANAAPNQYPQLSQIEQQYDLQESAGSFHTGLFGNAAKWLYSPTTNAFGQHWYTLVPAADGGSASLYAWDGGTSSVPANAQPLAIVDGSVYANPALLLNAKAPLAPVGVTASLSGGVLTLNGPASFVGTFEVTVTATDGVLSSAQSFLVTTTDTPPVLNNIPPQTVSASGPPLQLTPGSTDAEGDTVSYSAQVAAYNPAYNLQQVYHFTGVGLLTVGGVSAYVLQSSVLGGVGGYYLLKSDGGVYAYDGSGGFSHSFANSANLIATLDPSVYSTPALLTQAQPPAAPVAAVSVSGNTLTVDVSGVAVGTVFEVFVTGSDGAETTRTGFLVTVTP
jgi:hypothetical protein